VRVVVERMRATGRDGLTLGHALEEQHRETAARDLPPVVGRDQLVVVVPGRARAGLVVGSEDDGVDVTAGRDAARARVDHHIRDAVHRVTALLVDVPHPRRDLLGAAPPTDVAVVRLAIRDKAAAEGGPVAAVDTRRVTDQDVGDVVANLWVDTTGHPGPPRRCP
jgi:hypothetical protein